MDAVPRLHRDACLLYTGVHGTALAPMATTVQNVTMLVDDLIRAAALTVVADLRVKWPGGVPAAELKSGFDFQGEVIALRSQTGIFRPRQMTGGALSISTVVPKTGPPRYDDEIAADAEYFVYRYRDNGPNSYDNRLLRQAYRDQSPLIYFRGIAPSVYEILSPCYVTRDDPVDGFVHVEVGDATLDAAAPRSSAEERRHVMRAVRQRLHQQRFRQMVLAAYSARCSICRLRELPLLDAAHILPDRDERGLAEVPNGLALCSIHHRAFDANLLGIRPDCTVQLAPRLLDETDGPMLEAGMKAFHGERLGLPKDVSDHPNPEYLEERYAAFMEAA